jgi:hypothetical protein
MKLERQLGVFSTFFFLNESIRFNPLHPKTFELSAGRYDIKDSEVTKTMRELDSSGWEIGVHGSFNSFQSLDLLTHEKKVLEDILGHEVVGIRQHYLNHSEKTWELQKEAGFKYYCSYGLTRAIGFKDNICNPFRPHNVKNFVVLPMGMMDYCLLTLNGNITQEYMAIINKVESAGGILVINWHQERMNPLENHQSIEAYTSIINECQRRSAWVTTCAGACSHLSEYNS